MRHVTSLGDSVAALALVLAACQTPPPFVTPRDSGPRVPRDAALDSPVAIDVDASGGDASGPDASTPTTGLDADAVYVVGHVVAGSCAIGLLPVGGVVPIVAFKCLTSSFVLNPRGEVFYQGEGARRYRFRPDPWDGTLDSFPLDPAANDTLVELSGSCGLPTQIRVDPTSGEIVRGCACSSSSCDWRRMNGEPFPVPATAVLVWPGHEGHSFYSDADRSFFVTSGSDSIPVVLGDRALYATSTVRTRTDGFRVVETRAPDPRALLHVPFDGVATELGTYPDPPAGIEMDPGCVLDATDRLYCTGNYETGDFADVIVRYTISAAEAEIVFDERSAVFELENGSKLVTGP